MKGVNQMKKVLIGSAIFFVTLVVFSLKFPAPTNQASLERGHGALHGGMMHARPTRDFLPTTGNDKEKQEANLIYQPLNSVTGSLHGGMMHGHRR